MCNLGIDAGEHNEAHEPASFLKAKWSRCGWKAEKGSGNVSLMNFSLKIK